MALATLKPAITTWKRVSVKDVCESIIDCVNKTAPTVEYVTPYKMIRTTNVKSGWIDLSEVKYVTSEIYERWTRRTKLQKGDVILTREAPLGEVGMLRHDDTVFLGQRLVLYRANPELLDNRFLLYAFQSHDLQAQIKSLGSGATVEHMRVPDCEKLTLCLPPLPTQRKIAAILSAYDDLIENNTRRIAILESMAQMLYREWFVHFRFPGHAAYKMIDSPLGPIPEGWQIVSLQEVCTQVASGGTPSRNDPLSWTQGAIPWFKTKELQDAHLFDSEETITEHAIRHSAAKLFPPGTVVMAIYAAPTVGRLGILTQPSAFNQAACGLVANSDLVCPEFLFYKLIELRGYFNRLAQGVAQQNLSVGKVRETKLALPNSATMQDFCEIVRPIWAVLANLRQSNDRLASSRDLLLPKLISGEVDIQNLPGEMEECI